MSAIVFTLIRDSVYRALEGGLTPAVIESLGAHAEGAHQGAVRTDVKNSVVFLPARLAKKIAGRNGMTMLAAMIDQSSVVNGMAVRVGERSVAALLAVDVRASREREQKPIRGRVSVPLHHLGERMSELPTDRPLLVYCAGGYRSSIAASLLQRQGFTKVSEMAAGIP